MALPQIVSQAHRSFAHQLQGVQGVNTSMDSPALPFLQHVLMVRFILILQH